MPIISSYKGCKITEGGRTKTAAKSAEAEPSFANTSAQKFASLKQCDNLTWGRRNNNSLQSSTRLDKSPLELTLLETKEIAAVASSYISTVEIPLSKHSPKPSLKAHNSAAILELTLMDLAKPTTDYPEQSLSSPPHPDSPFVLTTEPSVLSLCQPAGGFNHWIWFRCLTFPVLVSKTQYNSSRDCISTTWTRLGLEGCCLNALLFRWSHKFHNPSRKKWHHS